MNGGKNYLKSGTRLILDTHILTNIDNPTAEKHETYTRLLNCILQHCPILVISARQEREMAPHFRRLRIRYPQVRPGYFQQLEEDNKLKKLSASQMHTLVGRKAFQGKGHDNVEDDEHLYQAASCIDKIAISDAPSLLNQRETLELFQNYDGLRRRWPGQAVP